MDIKGKGEIFTYWVTGKVEKKAAVTVFPRPSSDGGVEDAAQQMLTSLQVEGDGVGTPCNGDISEVVWRISSWCSACKFRMFEGLSIYSIDMPLYTEWLPVQITHLAAALFYRKRAVQLIACESEQN